ncbi:MAG TPA: hypothetical protein GXX29_06325, partial [Firmicutes bacterium]|nr:hypothetical protein [Bacillota bacterium]
MASNILPQKSPCRWQAGWYQVDITPPLGVWMSGFGLRYKGAEGVLDPLYATAMVFDDGQTQAAIVSCDLLCLDAGDAAQIRLSIAEKTGIPPEQIIIHTTHTHSGPLTSTFHGFGSRDAAYDSVLQRQIVSAVVLARQRLQPVSLTYGEALAPIGINRREQRGGNVVIGEDNTGLVDPRAVVIGVWPADTAGNSGAQATDHTVDAERGVEAEKEPLEPLAMILWAAVHPVILGGSNYLLSRDFPGFAAARLKKTLPGTLCLYTSGPCGDVNPIRMREPNRIESARYIGNLLAASALTALTKGTPLTGEGIRAARHFIRVPLGPLPPLAEIRKEAAQIRREIVAAGIDVENRLALNIYLEWAKDAEAAVKEWAGSAASLLDLSKPSIMLHDDFEAELQAIAIGDLVFTAFPFETFVSYQNEAAQRVPEGKKVLVLGCANGDYGYLPDEAGFAKGGYEVNGLAYKLYGLQPLSPA